MTDDVRGQCPWGEVASEEYFPNYLSPFSLSPLTDMKFCAFENKTLALK